MLFDFVLVHRWHCLKVKYFVDFNQDCLVKGFVKDFVGSSFKSNMSLYYKIFIMKSSNDLHTKIKLPCAVSCRFNSLFTSSFKSK